MEMGWWSPMRSVFFSGVTPMNGGMGLNWRPHGCPPVDRWISLKDKWRTWKHWTSPWTYGCFMMSCNFLIKLKPSRWYYMCPFWNWDGFSHSAELMICRAGKECAFCPTCCYHLKSFAQLSNIYLQYTKSQERVRGLPFRWKSDITAVFFEGTWCPLGWLVFGFTMPMVWQTYTHTQDRWVGRSHGSFFVALSRMWGTETKTLGI